MCVKGGGGLGVFQANSQWLEFQTASGWSFKHVEKVYERGCLNHVVVV